MIRVLGRRGYDQDRIVVLVGDDLDVAARFPGRRRRDRAGDGTLHGAGAWRLRRRGLLLRGSHTGTVACASIAGRRDDRSRRRAGRELRSARPWACCVTRPVNACCSSGAIRSARPFCTWWT